MGDVGELKTNRETLIEEQQDDGEEEPRYWLVVIKHSEIRPDASTCTAEGCYDEVSGIAGYKSSKVFRVTIERDTLGCMMIC